MSFQEKTFDLVILDPPYYDAIPYEELSDFFYVWLKRSVGFLYPDTFSTSLSPKEEELKIQGIGIQKKQTETAIEAYQI